MVDRATRTLAIGIAATAIVVAGGMFLFFRYGGGILRSPGDASASAAGQDQQQPPQFAHMELQGQFAGPLAGTIIQRWRDPVDGTICYIYLPMVVHHTPAPSGYVEYGSNPIGAISCLRAPSSAAKP